MFRELLEHIKAVGAVNKILETYKRVTTDEKAVLDNGVEFTPVATLVDEFGGRAQIDIDDSCYVLALKQPDGKYKWTNHIFAESHEVLKDLPSPLEMKIRMIKEKKYKLIKPLTKVQEQWKDKIGEFIKEEDGLIGLRFNDGKEIYFYPDQVEIVEGII